MSQPPDEVPPWGTPDYGTPDYGAPDYGAPDYGALDDRTTHQGTTDQGTPDIGTPDSGTPDYGTPVYGTPEAKEPDLHSVDTLVVQQRQGRRASGDYDLITVDGVQLGSLLKETSTAGLIFSPALSTTYRMLNPRGFLIATLEGPGLLGPARFVVTDLRGAPVGVIEEEIRYSAPGLLLIGANGGQFRLNSWNCGDGNWQLTDGVDEARELGRVSREDAGADRRAVRRQRFSVQLSPTLIGARRLLAIMATVCLDHISDTERRRPR